VTYSLDGKPISGGDLVGKSGDVGITFDVRNTSARTQAVRYRDATGATHTMQAQVPIPMVAQLQLVLPPENFTQVDAEKADVFTDPLGNKLVNWSFVFVPPIGDLAQTATLRAHVENFRLGEVRLAGSQVAPKDQAFLDYAETQLAGGVDSASSLYTGSAQIAGNLDKLHAG